jgi:DNA-binding response OmpR family regulator
VTRLLAQILVVHDKLDLGPDLATILEDAGLDVVETEDGNQVFGISVSETPNVVLLDVIMPRVNVFDALSTLKDNTGTCPIPVIMVTAKGWSEYLTIARSFGGVEHIKKPYVDGDVELRVNCALRSDHQQKSR